MNKLITALSVLIVLGFLVGFLVGGYFLWKHILSILDFGESMFVWLSILCASIWFGRQNKDGIYRLLKDTHQSNLDDIKEQELEDSNSPIKNV